MLLETSRKVGKLGKAFPTCVSEDMDNTRLKTIFSVLTGQGFALQQPCLM